MRSEFKAMFVSVELLRLGISTCRFDMKSCVPNRFCSNSNGISLNSNGNIDRSMRKSCSKCCSKVGVDVSRARSLYSPRKRDLIAKTRKKCEDLEFQLMELETRCEVELEQAEDHFQNEQKIMSRHAQMRQVNPVRPKKRPVTICPL